MHLAQENNLHLLNLTERAIAALQPRMSELGRWKTYWLAESAVCRPDMNIFNHSFRTSKQGISFGEHRYRLGVSGPEETATLGILGWIHDLGELKVGDLNWDDQQSPELSAQFRAKEHEYFNSNLSTWFADLSPLRLDKLRALFLVGCPKGDTDVVPLAKVFQTVERLGYILAALDHFEAKFDEVDWLTMTVSVISHRGAWALDAVVHEQGVREFLMPNLARLRDTIEFLQSNPHLVSLALEKEHKIISRHGGRTRELSCDLQPWIQILERFK